MRANTAKEIPKTISMFTTTHATPTQVSPLDLTFLLPMGPTASGLHSTAEGAVMLLQDLGPTHSLMEVATISSRASVLLCHLLQMLLGRVLADAEYLYSYDRMYYSSYLTYVALKK